MDRRRRNFSQEFKLQVVKELEGSIFFVKEETAYEIDHGVVARWYREYRKYGENAFLGNGKPYKEDARIAQLERKIGQLTIENDFLKKALQGINRKRGS